MFLPSYIDLSKSEKYVLSIRISSADFMFSISEPHNGKNYCLKETRLETGNISIAESIKKIIFDLNFLTLQFARTNVIYVSSDYTLVPAEYYDSKRKDVVFPASPFSEAGTSILENDLARYNIHTLYKVDEELHQFLSRSLCDPHFYHHTTSLTNFFEGKSKSISLFSKLYVNLHNDYTDILCFAENKLSIAQTHQGLTNSEQIYFILKIWESLNLDQLKDQLLIAGEFSSDTLSILKEYITNIERVAHPSEIYLWHEDAQQAPIDLISFSL